MDSNGKSQSTVGVLRGYFDKRSAVETLAGFKAELDQLASEEKEALAEGIRNGSLNY